MPTTRKSLNRRKSSSERDTLFNLNCNHFLFDFPNPKRLGCPDPAQLKLLARAPGLAPESVLNHVYCCTPCYHHFSRFLCALRRKPHSPRDSPPKRPDLTD